MDDLKSNRIAHAFAALDEDGEIARRRVWLRVQHGIELDRRRRRRRWAIAGAGSIAAALAVALPLATQQLASPADEPESVSAQAVWEMLASQPGASDDYGSLQEFVLSMAGEAETGAQ